MKPAFQREPAGVILQNPFFNKYRPVVITDKILASHNRARMYCLRKYVALDNDKQRACLQLGTAPDFTLTSLETRGNIEGPTVYPITQLAHSASGEKINIIGAVPCTVSKGHVTTNATIYDTKNPALGFLGLD